MMDSRATPRLDNLTGLLESYHQLRGLQRRLHILRHRLDEARCYLATPGGNRHLGQVQLERVRARYSATLAGLRAARHEAHHRLGLTGPTDRQGLA